MTRQEVAGLATIVADEIDAAATRIEVPPGDDPAVRVLRALAGAMYRTATRLTRAEGGGWARIG